MLTSFVTYTPLATALLVGSHRTVHFAPSLMLAALASGATQFVTYGLINFAVLFLMREKGMTLNQVAVYCALVVAIGMGGSMLLSGHRGDCGVYSAWVDPAK